MAGKTKAERRRERARRELAGKGWTAVFIGILLLTVLPLLLKGVFAGALGSALRPAGWAALAIGVVLLALNYLTNRSAVPTPAAVEPARPAPARTSQQPPMTPAPAPRMESQWSPSVLAAIEWRRFEAVCEALYAQAGFATRSQSHGADGGIDIWLQSRHSDVPRIVQCKHWQTKTVGVKEMREFFGVMASHQLKSGTYVTSSTFSGDAIAFAKANGIHAQDGAALLKLISQRTPEQQAALLAVAYEGEYWRPTCASCGAKMIEKNSKKNDGSFWGCANYRRCGGRTISKAKAVATA
ncbi:MULTISPECIES: restriction endonuclease [Variovorax]|jgi:restriction system protein|uniref:restriction endonuclease n=1 Tax=Variovorax TaxID=34072 RepID=UPI00086F3546|nr:MULTISPECIES: restriction endonuclease [Variovorax]MBN8758085.1 restriction endonuclease [Variovorax sp.]ODU12357.1 MAG: restriction endonuclease [Variovorax sp. SCN 67-85]ODV23218.1 MAG: restriction endonuclease [Variovorax sp. SCN 67-20]OJZ07877.1 MAG: restriction endonuclease [Variovorax sp. 67-131]UKI10746.1 restriction endonuclease [Variovorax paradoxus]